MIKKLFFDSDVLIDILKNKNETVSQVREFASQTEEFCCSVVNVAEVFAGMRPNEEVSTRQLIGGLTHFDVTVELAELAGQLKFKTRTHTLWLDDCIVAVTAMANDGVLLTKNVKHYPFKDLKLQRIV